MLWNYERGYTFTKSEKFLIDEYRCYVKNFQEKRYPGGPSRICPFSSIRPFPPAGTSGRSSWRAIPALPTAASSSGICT